MKKNYSILTLLLFVFTISVQAQQKIKNFDLTGFDITFIESPTFSYKHDNSRRVVESVANGKLTMKVEDGNPRDETKVKLTIYAPIIESMTLKSSDWTHDVQGGALNRINFYLSSHAKVNLTNLKSARINAKIESGAELNMQGSVTETICNVNGASTLNTTALTGDVFRIDIVSGSKAVLDMNVQSLTLNAKYGVEVTLKGSATKFDFDGNMAVRLHGEGMLIDDAFLNGNRGCEIVINAKKMNENPEVKNVFKQK